MIDQQHTQAHTRRDLFLAAALQGILASGYMQTIKFMADGASPPDDLYRMFADAATKMADAMLEENPDA